MWASSLPLRSPSCGIHIALTPEEQKMVARTRKTRKFFVLLRERRYELLETALQDTLARAYSSEPGGTEPVDSGVVGSRDAVAGLCTVSDRDAVELTVMD